MTEQSWNPWFDAQLDLLANREASKTPAPQPAEGTPPADLVNDLRAAARIAALNLGHESKTRAALRTRLAWMAMAKAPAGRARQPDYRVISHSLHFRGSWLAGLTALFLVVFLAVFNQPALAMVQHILGYGYLPEVGFFPLSGTLLLKGSVELQQNERQVFVRQGISIQNQSTGPGVTWLWIEDNSESLSLGETWLDLAQGNHLPVQAIDRMGNHQARLAFVNLPAGTTRAVLRLEGGGELPLDWNQAAESGMAQTRVTTPTLTQTQPRLSMTYPCLEISAQLMLCAQAAYVDEQGTHLLLAVQGGMSARLDGNILQQAELRDARQQVYLLGGSSAGSTNGTESLTLQFAAVPDGIADVTLHLPGIQINQGGKAEWIAGPFDLPLRLPARVESISPTPTILKTTQRQPVPTPVVTSQP